MFNRVFGPGPKLSLSLAVLALIISGAPAAGGPTTNTDRGEQQFPRVVFLPPVIDLFHPAEISVAGIASRDPEVRLLGAIDRHGLAYEWTPYPWRRLRLLHGTWHGVLPAPPLFGVYQLQLRLDSRKVLTSSRWLLRVFPAEAKRRRSFPTALAAIRDFVAGRAGKMQLIAVRPWRQAAFDHRDRRLNRMFVIAYAPGRDKRPDSRLGLFITTVRNGFHGRWRLLTATTRPYD
jgi:hypothetical protein